MPRTRSGKRVVIESHDEVESGEESSRRIEREVKSPSLEVKPRQAPSSIDFVFRDFLRRQPLEMFDGKNKRGEDVEVWVSKLEEYFTYVPLLNLEKAQAASLLLSGPTKPWWEANIKLHNWRRAEIDWEFMRGRILDQYCSK
jgi:hypothetical protein